MTHVLVEAAENINSVAEEHIKKDRGEKMVELDQFKYMLGTYEKPLKEVGDSL